MPSSHQGPDVGGCAPDEGNRAASSGFRRSIPAYLQIAVILAPFGVKGEVKVSIETEFPERFAQLRRVFVGPDHQPYEIESFRRHGEFGLLKLVGVDCNGAEKLRDLSVEIPTSEAVPLKPGEYYVYQVEGLRVLTEDGQDLGRVAEVLFTGSNQVYVVQGPQGEILLPALQGVVLEIDLAQERMTVRIPAGLLDEAPAPQE